MAASIPEIVQEFLHRLRRTGPGNVAPEHIGGHNKNEVEVDAGASAAPIMPINFHPPIEFTRRDCEIVNYVFLNGLSMTSPERLYATIQAAKHAVIAEIAGDFVECGVWRGGNALAAKMIFEEFGSNKRVYLFDTFAGMTQPTDRDVEASTMTLARPIYEASQKQDYNSWCYASLRDVEQSFRQAGVSMRDVHFVQGDVCVTLDNPAYLPEKISVLRLDTDWYESTAKELAVLYPRLSERGVLLIDDYGHWAGARQAV